MLKKYFYTGYLKNGTVKFGIEKGNNEKVIRDLLKSRDIFLKNIIKISLISEKQKFSHIINFFTECRIFVKNGYSFFKILDILEENTDFKLYTDRMKISMKKGESIYEIFKKSGINLKNTELMIIKSGEESGNLCRALEIIEEGLKEKERIKKDMRKIMIYPVIVFMVIIFLILFLGFFILPDFIKIIENTDKNLPKITKAIIWGTNNFLYIIFICLLSIIIFIFVIRKENTREKIFEYSLKIPVIKDIQNKIFISTFTEILSILLYSGITIIESINLIKEELRYKHFKFKLEKSREELKKGNTIYSAFKNMEIFSKTEIELIKTGEESGELVEVLKLISQRTKENLKQKTDIGIKTAEPLLIIIIGIIIGIVFLGIYMPVFQMMDGI